MSNSNSIPLPTDPRFKDLTGKVFTRLTVLGYAGRVHFKAKSMHKWSTRCECGTEGEVLGANLASGGTQSCGCLVAEKTSKRSLEHGMSGSSEYNAWCSMWLRCTNPNHEFYHLYKGRTPPPEWRSFERFLADVGPKPGKGYSLDRIDNDKPYGPGNCRWVTQHVQTRNMSHNVWVTTPDGQRLILTDACKLVGVPRGSVSARRSKGWTMEEASNGLLREAA